MKILSKTIIYGLVVFVVAPLVSATTTDDDWLVRKVIAAYQIAPLDTSPPPFGPKEILGQALFFDPVVSGPKRVACATCHIRRFGSGDGLAMSVGVGGEGTGPIRLTSKDALLIPRNALPLFQRGDPAFLAFFWDGRVQLGPNGRLETPLGDKLPAGFDNLLAAATVFPLAGQDEMLGRGDDTATSTTYHAGLVTLPGNTSNYQKRTLNAFTNLVTRLLGTDQKIPDPAEARYRVLFKHAYPSTALTALNITHVGNALAAYIASAFALQPSAWDRYVLGDTTALSASQKHGAIVFFGKGRCAVCHSGRLFSDFQFHGIAVPQLRPGKQGRYTDYGRAAATGRGDDRYLFRTPPLRDVVQTGPWGHNGYFAALKTIIEHHLNPVPALYHAQETDPDTAAYSGRLLGFRSPILAEIAPLSSPDIDDLIAFLGALSSTPYLSDTVAIPDAVPSGKLEFAQP